MTVAGAISTGHRRVYVRQLAGRHRQADLPRESNEAERGEIATAQAALDRDRVWTRIVSSRAEQQRDSRTMNRNVLYLLIGALAVAAVVLSYLFYQERQKTTGIEIDVGKSSISIEKK